MQILAAFFHYFVKVACRISVKYRKKKKKKEKEKKGKRILRELLKYLHFLSHVNNKCHQQQ